MAKVFYISSTWGDLIEERAAVRQAVQNTGHRVIAMEDYPAESRPPLAKCLADVARSDAYIGILAFRYGSRPPPPDDSLSFSHAEYREASRLGKPIHVFLKDEDAPTRSRQLIDRDPSAIDEFRAEVLRDRTTRFFQVTDDLESQVTQTLRVVHGLGRMLPTGVAHQVDRVQQRLELGTLLEAARQGDEPAFGVIHGRRGQEHVQLLDDVRQRLGPEVLDSEAPMPKATIGIPPEAVASGRLGESMEASLSMSVSQPGMPERISIEEMAAEIAVRYPDGFIVEIQLDSSFWKSAKNPLDGVLGFSRRWPRPVQHPLVMLVSVEYEWRTGSWWSSAGRSERRARAAVERITATPSIHVIPELVDVSRSEAQAWARSGVAAGFASERRLLVEIDEVFAAEAEIPMRSLVEAFEGLLAASAGAAA